MPVVVDREKCIGCGVCADACGVGAITVEDVAIIDEEKCVSCGACVDACPQDAIEMS